MPAARLVAANPLGDLRDVLRRGAAAATGDVQEAASREALHQRTRDIGRFVETRLAHRVGQPGVWMLFGINARDPRTFGGVVLVLLAVAFGACVAPALRATRVSPLEALKGE